MEARKASHDDWHSKNRGEDILKEYEENKESKEEKYEAKIKLIDEDGRKRFVALNSLESSERQRFWNLRASPNRKEEQSSGVFSALSKIVHKKVRNSDVTDKDLDEEKKENREKMISCFGSWDEEEAKNLKEEIRENRESGSR